MSDQDIGDAEFEDRLRGLLGDGPARPVSAAAVIAGAKRRRSRRRATAAGSSLAALAVVGVAAGAAVVSGGSGESSGATPASRTTAVSTKSAPATPTPLPATCSASVTGTVPQPEVSTDEQNLRWDAFSGTVAGSTWSVELHVVPDAASYAKFANKVPGSVPSQAIAAMHPGAKAVFRSKVLKQEGWAAMGKPEGDPPFVTLSGTTLNEGAAYSYGWVASTVDHMCLQYKDHAEFVPVLKVQGDTFAIFGVAKEDQAQALIGYDAQGREIGKKKVLEPPEFASG